VITQDSKKKNLSGTIMKVSLIGLGIMGEPIARNLLKAGFSLTVFNRSLIKSNPFKGLAVIAGSAQEAISASDVTILVVPSEKEIDEVLHVVDSRIQAQIKNKIIVNIATVAPEYSERISIEITAAGGNYIEAPVSGSRKPAEEGNLVILAAGEDTYIDRIQHIFSAIGKTTLRCGAPPNAMRMKLANNLLLIGMLEAFVEAYHFAHQIGVDTEQFLNLILSGQMANDFFRTKATKLLTDDFTQQAALRNVAKDTHLICQEAKRNGIHIPVALVNESLFKQAFEAGLGDEDIIAVMKIFEKINFNPCK